MNYKNKNCIVTGGSGFIGQAIIEALIAHGARVFVIDNFSFGAKNKSINHNATIITGDIREYKTFNKLPKLKYDYFFHFAAPSSIVLFNENAVDCFDITVNGFLNAIRFCLKNNIRLVYPSTGSLYSGTMPPQAENTELSLMSLNSYAVGKLSLELIHNSIRELNAVGLRIFAGYGPQERHKGKFASVIYLFCKDILNGKQPIIFGDGSQKRDFVYIDDVVEAILVLAQKCKEPVVNIGSGRSISFNDIIRIINKITGKQVVPKYIKKPRQYLEETQADNKLLLKYYAIKFTIEEGIRQTIASI